jgi:putative ABC transport system permease protein
MRARGFCGGGRVILLAWRFALRDLRGGVSRLWIVVACLALGVAVIAGVGTLREATQRGLETDGRTLLGGDMAIEGGAQPLPDALRAWLRERGARMSDAVTMRAMLVAPSGERQLVDLKAVDAAWPLLGAPTIAPPQTLKAALGGRDGKPGLLAERIVLDRLGLHAGDVVRVGNASFSVSGVEVDEPDRVVGAGMFGPRALIALDALPATGLVLPGAMLQYTLRAALPDGADGGAAIAALRAAFPDNGWHIRGPGDAAPGVGRFVDQTALFMSLVGLTALLVGGIGVANGVRAWLESRVRTIATLRCLGASARLVFAVCLIQVLLLSAVGIAIGLAAGTVLPVAAAGLLRDLLPVPPVNGVYPVPLLLAAAYGLLTAIAFALLPLGRAASIPGAALFRDALLPERVRPSLSLIGVIALAGGLLIAMTVLTAPDRAFALWFCVASIGTLALFRAGGALLMLAARNAPRMPTPWARLGLGNLYRPGSATPLMLVSVGLGLSTLAAVALIQGNIRAQILEQLPTNAPSFYFIDIQNDQLARFAGLVKAQPGASDFQEVPSLRARVVAVNGVPADQVKATPETRFALSGDRGLTYAAKPPDGTRIVAGAWWPPDYTGPPLVSFDAGLAKGWGVHVGDTIRVNVLGRDIDLKVASLRDIQWRSMGINYFMVASPGLLGQAPHTHIATVRVPASGQGAFLRAVTDAFPNVTGILVTDVLAAVAALLDRIAAALAATGSLTLAAGALVLVAAVAAGQRRRTQEAVLLKVLGASFGQSRGAWLVEFGTLGLTAGVIAALVGTAASYGVMRFVMHADWAFLPGTLAATLLACLAVMLAVGYTGTARALRAKAAPLLRNE